MNDDAKTTDDGTATLNVDAANDNATGAAANAPDTPDPAETGSDAQPDAVQTGERTFTQSDVERIVKQRLDRERERAEEERKEAEERAKLSAEERLKRDLDEATERAAAAEERAAAAERRSQLTGRVSNVDAALKLLDPERHVDDDGAVNIEALIADFEILAPNDQPDAPRTRSAPAGVKRAGRKFKMSDLAGMTPDQINAHWDEIREDMGRNEP